ncbi:MAG: methylmalonate-semialdehyde dehydrogenase, partial [Armatimonadetes bacterium]|nr:methylmalonate-semialdehyde dehydrogenase [Armatimonadota bacterium]
MTAETSRVPHWIGGRALETESATPIPVSSPLDGRSLGALAPAGPEAVEVTVRLAREAFESWSRVPIKERVQPLYRFKALVEEHLVELSALVTRENGKTVGESEAGIRRGLEVVEFAAALPALGAGELLEVSSGVDCYTRRLPLGVTAGITPFNFPAMVPMWMFPLAIAAGNSFILKPSEQVPLTPLRLAELLQEAGLPAGVFSVLQGDRQTSEALLDHPEIEAVAFVGSTPAARAVYERGTAAGKRVLALGGAKNHLVVLPDADPDATARNVVSSAMGCAGQRCMAASVLILVGRGAATEAILDAVTEQARALRIGVDVGAIISAPARDRILGYIDRAAARGARLRLDGRGAASAVRSDGAAPEGAADGYYVGPTVLDGLAAEDECLRDEIFGPVLSVIRVDTLDEAISIENRSPYGNAASLYTRDGAAAAY